ncbi:MAG: phosphate acyltransferase PlsX [Gemmatimonadaceae bacterium]
MARIALDVMGGDFAPEAPIAGALLAISDAAHEHTIQLVGQPEVIRACLDTSLGGEFAHTRDRAARLEVVPAADVIEMTEKPTAALRGKPDSSMAVGLKLQVAQKSDAFVSAGNTGAQMALSTFILRLHPGLTRPAISTFFPTAREPVVVLDSGANVDCSAEELLQFARLGAVYAEDLLGRKDPVIGLLSIGEEPEKGNAVVKEAHQLLRDSGLNFQGNIEGRDLPAGASDRGPFDVVVCDGFVGNVVLKFYEAVAPMILAAVRQKLGVDEQALRAAFKQLDYSEHGGAPLLGVRGVSIISHGKSSPRAIKNAIGVAIRAVESGMNEHIARRLVPGERAPQGAGT